jgi:hypothetical protein
MIGTLMEVAKASRVPVAYPVRLTKLQLRISSHLYSTKRITHDEPGQHSSVAKHRLSLVPPFPDLADRKHTQLCTVHDIGKDLEMPEKFGRQLFLYSLGHRRLGTERGRGGDKKGKVSRDFFFWERNQFYWSSNVYFYV